MKPFRKILVPVDFSTHSARAVQVAAELAHRYEGSLEIVHIFDPVAYPLPDGYVMFTAAKSHFASHAIDFDLVQAARASIPGAGGGKGNVSVKYPNEAAKPALRSFIDAVMARHGIPSA